MGGYMSSSFRDLRVWQESMKRVFAVYRDTKGFPKDELYGLVRQMRRAAVSIPSNIAEGKGMRTDPEFARFLFHARGSLMELQTHVLIAKELRYLQEPAADALMAQCEAVGRALAGLINSMTGQAAHEGQRPTTKDQRLRPRCLND
ncbi:MAG: four helix bundle protein [Candidatus Koribacter versatilis]|uniref:Four helix bundle protein n=1 Tax=Candidatus Korobacter versatilis TaxID=658062 RepID=A0A932AAC9_9BACT|nr:four helix bundle protein [Candidatus Koribacter versatilis]